MFRIQCFVDDKHLSRVMHALAGMVLDLRVDPVANASGDGRGGVRAVTNGQVAPAFRVWAKRSKKTAFSAPDIREFCREYGRAEGSYSHTLKQLQQHGVLRKGPGKGHKSGYLLVPGGDK